MDRKVLTLMIVGTVAIGSIVYGIVTPSGARRKGMPEIGPLPPGVPPPPPIPADGSAPPVTPAVTVAPAGAHTPPAPGGGPPRPGTFPGGAPPPQPLAAWVPSQGASGTGDSFMSPGSGMRHKRPRTTFRSWGRDPFSRADLLILRGIAWDPENPKAIISDRIAEIGEEVGGNMIIDIRPDSVILSNGRDDFILTLPEGSAPDNSGSPKIPNGPPRELKPPPPAPKPRLDRPPPNPPGG